MLQTPKKWREPSHSVTSPLSRSAKPLVPNPTRAAVALASTPAALAGTSPAFATGASPTFAAAVGVATLGPGVKGQSDAFEDSAIQNLCETGFRNKPGKGGLAINNNCPGDFFGPGFCNNKPFIKITRQNGLLLTISLTTIADDITMILYHLRRLPGSFPLTHLAATRFRAALHQSVVW